VRGGDLRPGDTLRAVDTPGWVSPALEAVRAGRARAAIIGCGYVGLTLAVEAARAGSPVTGIDVNEALVKELRAGSNPVPDVFIPDGEIAQLRDSGHLTFAASMEGPFDIYVICVHTPLREGSPDLRYVESAAESVSRVLQRGALVVLESTTYPGTTEELLRPILEEATGLTAGVDFSIAHSPERINPGDTAWGLHNTPKVVGGLEPWCTELACAFYDRFAHSVVPVSSPRAAEITKLFENSHRLVNIALANEMAIVCHDFGIDPWEVLQAASSKPFGFTPFRPGPGVGGECIPVDPQYLAWRARGKLGRAFRMLETARDVNDRMPAHVAQRAAEILNESGKAVRGARVLLLGVAFKGSSAVTRESPAVRVADRLATSGAELTYHDPFVPHASFNGVVYESQELSDTVLDEADLVIVLTDHPNVDYDRVVDRANVVYDTRGVTESIKTPRATVHRA
jgi:UDP-N-acetyl-D-glucosamine dehydrogenase